MAYLQIREIKRHFSGHRAVDGVTVDVQQGEFVSLLGPSGSGKTTLLRMVAGFERPDAGTIHLENEDITQVPPQKRQIGMVFQSYALFPNLTAAGNVAFGLKVRKESSSVITAHVAELLDLVGLADKADRYPHQLSGGEQQRVALARALAPSPRVLLLDEPLSALDARIRLTLRTEIRRIQRALNITTLYVTHDQEEALILSDRILVFNSGRVEQVGRPEEIYDHPATEFVSSFVGSVNQVHAVVQSPAERLCLVGEVPIRVEAFPDSAGPGDSVVLWIRPERMRLTASEGANRLPGVVEDVMFLGPRAGLRISSGAETFLVEMARDPSRPLPAPGTAVDVFFSTGVLVTQPPTG
ncbi:MAG: ATP-binding cassette domain-containing protein [Thermaerobacter sp.]|nr:ATP-binding cassette domain-containing protein [Thermaerobacter sp.]